MARTAPSGTRSRISAIASGWRTSRGGGPPPAPAAAGAPSAGGPSAGGGAPFRGPAAGGRRAPAGRRTSTWIVKWSSGASRTPGWGARQRGQGPPPSAAAAARAASRRPGATRAYFSGGGMRAPQAKQTTRSHRTTSATAVGWRTRARSSITPRWPGQVSLSRPQVTQAYL